MRFTSIVVTYNEERRLKECLKALDFCDEKIVVDLASKDRCKEIAKSMGCKVLDHKRVDVVEQVREWTVQQASNDWIIFIDPDEVFPKEAIQEIERSILNDAKLGEIRIPKVNHFQGQEIKYGYWGGKAAFLSIFKKEAAVFSQKVHQRIKVKEGYNYKLLNQYSIKHYWIDSTEQFYKKHLRYVKYEGENRYSLGMRFSYFGMIKDLLYKFILHYVILKGFLDGLLGLKLLKLSMWYEYNAWKSLKKYQPTNSNPI